MLIVLPSSILVRALLGSILAGALCALVGVFVVRLKLSSMGFCMSHAAFAGAALGLVVGAEPLLTGIVFSIAVALLLGPISDKAKLHPDVVIGVMFSIMIALGFIFLNYAPGPVVGRQALSILWGSILSLTQTDLLYLISLTALTVSLIMIFFKEFYAVMFDRRMAEADGINAKGFIYLILFLTGLVVALSLKLVGGLLVYALMVLPASAALQFLYDMRKVMLFSPLIGVLNCVLGFVISFIFDLPVGSAMVVMSSIAFSIAVTLSPKRKRG